MIARIWRGWTTPENAGIFAKNVPGFRRIEVLRRNAGAEVEFTTIMRFDSMDSVKAFVGEDFEAAYVPDAARKLLKRFDGRAQHYEQRLQRNA